MNIRRNEPTHTNAKRTRENEQNHGKKKNREKTKKKKKKKKRTVGRTKTRNIRGMNLASLGTRADREKKKDTKRTGYVLSQCSKSKIADLAYSSMRCTRQEIIEKKDSQGKLLPEMILICQNLRNNLQHPNEYVRGCTLKFLARMTELEILEPLVPSVMANLEHRHSYVRRNAVLALDAMFKLEGGENLLPDAPEMIEQFLSSETDAGARRNALLMLMNADEDRAVHFLLENTDNIGNWGEIMQMVVLELVRRVCRHKPSQKGKLMRIIILLLNSSNASVLYECANTLVALSSAPTAIRAAANCFCQLLASQSDNNVKLIVLDRLDNLKELHKDIMQEVIMDILRAVSSPNLDIQKKTLDITLDLVNVRNIDDVVSVLKKEVMKTQDGEGKAAEYRQLLVHAIHHCALKFPDIASNVIHLLMDFLGDTNTASALDVAFFVREIAETNNKLRASIVDQLLNSFYQIRSSRVCACVLWIIGEYCSSLKQIESALDTIKTSVGSLPFYQAAQAEGSEMEKDEPTSPSYAINSRPAILADGTYATQSAVVETISESDSSIPNLRSLLLVGDFFLGSVLTTCFTKLCLKMIQSGASLPASQINRSVAEVMLYIVSIVRLNELPELKKSSDEDSFDRMLLCIKVLANPEEKIRKLWLSDCRHSFSKMIKEKIAQETSEQQEKEKESFAQPDDLIDFRHLKTRRGMTQLEVEDEVANDLGRATGFDNSSSGEQKLDRILQLTGFSDPIYAEACVTVHQYDIVLDVTILNRTNETLQNISLELATMGDLKLVERPQSYTLAAGAQKCVRANIKVSSTETGVIFGNVTFDTSSSVDKTVVVLNDVHIDIMDYISPASCHDVAFRSMWAEFEWENKVAVNTEMTDIHQFLDHLVASTNMKCLTPPSALKGDCGYLAANMYARSVFGEDALVNVSFEKLSDGNIGGFIRIRSKTQGIALSLGDKITLRQKPLK